MQSIGSLKIMWIAPTWFQAASTYCFIRPHTRCAAYHAGVAQPPAPCGYQH
ncbi:MULTISPECIES: hypothetical protein [Kingella]|uniref:Uncharacterized protein n=1 Tax=Kingella bonacorsii TaxID=2796361 RepID=A0ABS1BTY6_9NEIS|nr:MULTISPECIES: hypothetical protein [Kingella]MBK0396713.1 hypothetical protein [Kingella bonacorsii]